MCRNCEVIFQFSKSLEKFSKSMLRRNKGATLNIPISSQRKTKLVSKYLKVKNDYENALLKNMNKFQQGKMSFDDYITSQKTAVKSAFTNAYSIGKDFGINSQVLDDNEKRFIVQQTTKEMQFMENFANDLQNNSGVMNYSKRMGMYVDSLDSMFGFGRLVYLPEETQIIWQLGETDKHCIDCLSYAAKSPYSKKTLPGFPKSGNSRCLSNCKCSLLYIADKQQISSGYDNFILNKKYANVGKKQVPSETQYKQLMSLRDEYYYNQYMYQLTKDQVYRDNYTAIMDEFNKYKKKNQLYFPVFFNTKQALSDVNQFKNNANFTFVEDYSKLNNGEFVSFFQGNKQMYGKIVKTFDTQVQVRTLEKIDYLLSPKSHILFKEK